MLIRHVRQRLPQRQHIFRFAVTRVVIRLTHGGLTDIPCRIAAHHAPSYPVGTLVSDDAIGPRAKAGRVVQSVDAAHNGHPCVLNKIMRGVAISRQSPGEPRQPWLPPFDQRRKCGGVTLLAVQHQHSTSNSS